MHLDPAASAIEELGGVTVVARRLGVNPTTVRRFRYPKYKSGTGGFIPNEYIFDLLKLSCEVGKPLSIEELVLTPTQRSTLSTLRTQSSAKPIEASSPQNPENVGVVW